MLGYTMGGGGGGGVKSTLFEEGDEMLEGIHLLTSTGLACTGLAGTGLTGTDLLTCTRFWVWITG